LQIISSQVDQARAQTVGTATKHKWTKLDTHSQATAVDKATGGNAFSLLSRGIHAFGHSYVHGTHYSLMSTLDAFHEGEHDLLELERELSRCLLNVSRILLTMAEFLRNQLNLGSDECFCALKSSHEAISHDLLCELSMMPPVG